MNKELMMEQEGKQISKYNEAMNQIIRLHNLWLKCEGFKEHGELEKYENSLRSAETELKYDIKKLSESLEENHESNYIEKLKQVQVKLMVCNNLILKTKKSMFIGAAMCKKWTVLIEKEELLREVQEESGKGGVRGNPSDDDDID